MATPTQAELDQAHRLLDELTFGGHSEDGAASVLALALAEIRERGENELMGLKLAADLQLAQAAEAAVFDFLNWLTPQNIQLMYWGKGSNHTVPEGVLFERWKQEKS